MLSYLAEKLSFGALQIQTVIWLTGVQMVHSVEEGGLLCPTIIIRQSANQSNACAGYLGDLL